MLCASSFGDNGDVTANGEAGSDSVTKAWSSLLRFRSLNSGEGARGWPCALLLHLEGGSENDRDLLEDGALAGEEAGRAINVNASSPSRETFCSKSSMLFEHHADTAVLLRTFGDPYSPDCAMDRTRALTPDANLQTLKAVQSQTIMGVW